MNTAAKVRQDKEANPWKYCRVARCHPLMPSVICCFMLVVVSFVEKCLEDYDCTVRQNRDRA